jgi:pseudoazurin
LRQINAALPRQVHAPPIDTESGLMRKTFILGAMLAALLAPGVAGGAEVEVRMLNRGAAGAMVFELPVVRIAPGDTVRFRAADKGHNAESVPGMLPGGATAFRGKINEGIVVTFDRAGAYGIRCMPHYGMGMVGLVVVGEPGNLAEAQAVRHPGRAAQVFATLLGQVTAQVAP